MSNPTPLAMPRERPYFSHRRKHAKVDLRNFLLPRLQAVIGQAPAQMSRPGLPAGGNVCSEAPSQRQLLAQMTRSIVVRRSPVEPASASSDFSKSACKCLSYCRLRLVMGRSSFSRNVLDECDPPGQAFGTQIVAFDDRPPRSLTHGHEGRGFGESLDVVSARAW